MNDAEGPRRRPFPPAPTIRLIALLVGCAVWATSAAKQNTAAAWLENGQRPALFSRGVPFSEPFETYLRTQFPRDPRLSPPRPPLPIVTAPRARNCILLIGDGMGLAHVSGAGLAAYGVGGRLAIQRMPVVGLVATHSSSSLLTDSGAAATALATGFRTYNGAVAEDADGRPLESYFLTAQRHGKRTGLVVTSSLTHGTPAPFVANVTWRYMEPEIAAQLIERNTNVLLGGGLGFFLPRSHPTRLGMRYDERNLLVEAVQRGYQTIFSENDMARLQGDRALGLFGLTSMSSAETARPPLCDMTSKALELLSRGDAGFCLMVEGSQIDWRSHAGDFEGALWETLEFDRAVERCLRFAERTGDTLVVVTADHETGGLGLSGRGADGVSGYWSAGYHTAVMVPLFACGPGSLSFAGVYENIEVPVKIATALELDEFPALRARLTAARTEKGP